MVRSRNSDECKDQDTCAYDDTVFSSVPRKPSLSAQIPEINMAPGTSAVLMASQLFQSPESNLNPNRPTAKLFEVEVKQAPGDSASLMGMQFHPGGLGGQEVNGPTRPIKRPVSWTAHEVIGTGGSASLMESQSHPVPMNENRKISAAALAAMAPGEQKPSLYRELQPLVACAGFEDDILRRRLHVPLGNLLLNEMSTKGVPYEEPDVVDSLMYGFPVVGQLPPCIVETQQVINVQHPFWPSWADAVWASLAPGFSSNTMTCSQKFDYCVCLL